MWPKSVFMPDDHNFDDMSEIEFDEYMKDIVDNVLPCEQFLLPQCGITGSGKMVTVYRLAPYFRYRWFANKLLDYYLTLNPGVYFFRDGNYPRQNAWICVKEL